MSEIATSRVPEVIKQEEAAAILITVSLQQDFVSYSLDTARLPTNVHVGQMESKRLLGPHGSLIPFLEAAHAIAPEKLAIIHICDEHDPVKHSAHLKKFRRHAEKGTQGQKLIDGIEDLALSRPNTYFVKASDLNDFKDTNLPEILNEVLAGRSLEEVKVGVIGVWTDAKVSFVIYDLKTGEKAEALSTCSALTASNSLARHFNALEHLENILDVKVFHSAGEFLNWLAPENTKIRLPHSEKENLIFTKVPSLPQAWPVDATKERNALVQLCTQDSKNVFLTPLAGGFSPSQVFISKHDDGASVIKVGFRDSVARERFGNERVQKILGEHIPTLTAYFEGNALAAMEMDLLQGKGSVGVNTFEGLATSDMSTETSVLLQSTLSYLLNGVMGRLYHSAELENCDMLMQYSFTDRSGEPLFVNGLQKNIESIITDSDSASLEELLKRGEGIYKGANPLQFYSEWLRDRSVFKEVYAGLVHGDLNLMNVLLSYDPGSSKFEDVWIIDFASCARMPSLTDFAKIENDLSYLILPCGNERDFERLLKIQAARLEGSGLRLEIPSNLIETPQEERYLELLRIVRNIARSVDPRPEAAMDCYRFALLRYAAHTLSFDQPNNFQKQLALHACSQLCSDIMSKS